MGLPYEFTESKNLPMEPNWESKYGESHEGFTRP